MSSQGERGRRWQEALLLLGQSSLHDVSLDAVAYSSAVRACAGARHWQEAAELVARWFWTFSLGFWTSSLGVLNLPKRTDDMAVSKHWVSSVGALMMRALIFGVHIRAPDVWKLPDPR